MFLFLFNYQNNLNDMYLFATLPILITHELEWRVWVNTHDMDESSMDIPDKESKLYLSKNTYLHKVT